ncbi:MAG: CvpA family protein [Clostridia bacterium]|nr:CvpA family protein [Clostridia bacterium]
MLNIADIVLIAIIAVFVIAGSVRGLVKTLFGLGSIVLSIILSLTLYPMVSDVLAQSKVGAIVQDSVSSLLSQEKQITESTELTETTENESSLPDFVQNTIDTATQQTTQALSATVTDAALNIISMLIVFVLVKILLWIIAKLLDLATKLPVIHGCNKLLGGVLGCVSGVLIVYLLLGLLTFTTLLNTTSDFGRTVQNSLILSQMYENNILLYFLHIK